MRSELLTTSVNAVLVALSLAALAGCASDPDQAARGQPPPRSLIIDALDANHDGVIDAAEIANAPAALKTLDQDQDGQLRYEEIHPRGRPEQAAEPEPVVRVLDVNRDDVIDAAEIANASAALRKLDQNGDGRLAPVEYQRERVTPVGPERRRPPVRGPMPYGRAQEPPGAHVPPVGETP